MGPSGHALGLWRYDVCSLASNSGFRSLGSCLAAELPFGNGGFRGLPGVCLGLTGGNNLRPWRSWVDEWRMLFCVPEAHCRRRHQKPGSLVVVCAVEPKCTPRSMSGLRRRAHGKDEATKSHRHVGLLTPSLSAKERPRTSSEHDSHGKKQQRPIAPPLPCPLSAVMPQWLRIQITRHKCPLLLLF